MKIVRPICCGMDVHKNIIVATIGITNKKTRITEYIQETFLIPIFNILEDEINIYLTHPKYVKAIKGKKTDKKDSKWISVIYLNMI